MTDTGLKELAALKQLQSLNITTIKLPEVTKAGIEELRKAVPGLKILR